MASKQFVRDIPVVRRPRWSETEARAILEEQSRSGLSIWAFARSRGLAVKRLYDWRARFAATSALANDGPPSGVSGSSSSPDRAVFPFVPVRLVPVRAAAEEGRDMLELWVAANRRIRVPTGFDENTLSRLLHLLDGEVVC